MGEGSITEGIGNSRIRANLDGAPLDDASQADDAQAVAMVYRLLHEEGFFIGASTGLNVAAAVSMGPGHRVVTVLCDSGARYASRCSIGIGCRQGAWMVPQRDGDPIKGPSSPTGADTNAGTGGRLGLSSQ